jgi:hypothetical protein
LEGKDWEDGKFTQFEVTVRGRRESKTRAERAGECLPSKGTALNSNPSTTIKKKTTKKPTSNMLV